MVLGAWAVGSVVGLPAAARADSGPVVAPRATDPAPSPTDEASGSPAGPSLVATEPVVGSGSLPQPGSDVSELILEEVAASTPTPSPTPQPDLFSMRLRVAKNVQQQWSYTCVAAAIQTELEIALGSFDTSGSQQMAIYEWGRANLEFGIRSGQPGLDFIARSRALNHFGGGKVRYRPVAMADGAYLLVRMARAMRISGLAQGAGVRGGTHAWTILGFVTTADPARVKSFAVVGVYVAGPNMKGKDPLTGTYMSAADLLAYWETYTDPDGSSRYNGQYLAVVGLRT